MRSFAWLVVGMAACSGEGGGKADDTGAPSSANDSVRAARLVFADCVSRTLEDTTTLLYTDVYDGEGWQISHDDDADVFGSSTTYERTGGRVVSSVTDYDDGDVTERTYDEHEHLAESVLTSGDDVEVTTYNLEHEGDRLVAYETLDSRTTLDDCENIVAVENNDSLSYEMSWEYATDCLPARLELIVDDPDFSFQETAIYEDGRPVRYTVSGDFDLVNDVEWDCL